MSTPGMAVRIGCALIVLAPIALGAQEGRRNPARDNRIREARAALQQLLTGEGAEGRIVERVHGAYAFAPSRVGLPDAPIANPASVGVFAVGPLLVVTGSLDDRGALTIKAYRLKRSPRFSAGAGADLPLEVKEASTRLVGTLDKALRPGAMSVATRSLDNPSALAKDTRANIASIRQASGQALKDHADDKVIAAIVRQWADLRSAVADIFPESDDAKALYGPPDNYDPWRYDLIFRQSRSVVAIGEPGEDTSRCSGVLIASDLVLTAAHCFGGASHTLPTDLQVWFNYARVPGGAPAPAIERRPIVEVVAPAKEQLKAMLEGAFDSTLLDYAIVRFAAPAGGPLTPPTAEAQCIRKRPLGRSDPVYVVGYPRGDPIMVHDSARVYLPYRIFDGPLYLQLRLDVEADLLASPDRVEYMKQFDQSYETVKDSNGIPVRLFHHVKDGGQPRMGIVADTFRGNSGGPVYDREHDQCVVGILVAGADDTGERLTVNWKQHERVLPSSAILEDAERQAPGLIARLKLGQQ